MPSVLFVTNELYPYDKGGIGRFIYNYCTWNKRQETPSDLHVLYTRRTAFARNWGNSEEHDFVLHTASDLPAKLQQDKIFGGSLDSATMSTLTAESTEIANLIERVCGKIDHSFDYIEFPDFGGPAIATIRQKKTGNAVFSNSQIVVRLHSAMTLIQIDEGAYHKPSEWFAAMSDVERYCLANADLVVGHVPSVIEYNQRTFGFSDSWKQKAVCEFPPVILSAKERTAASRAAASSHRNETIGRRFVFSSRFQVFKRPDLFIDGAICYLLRNPDTSDKFILASYGWDKSFIQSLRERIPDRLHNQIILKTDQTHDERIETLSSAIIVIPSTYESFCIFAYECLLLSRKIVLNEKCISFGLNHFWQNDKNCKLFSGTAESMADALEQIDELEPPKLLELPRSNPYWLRKLPKTVTSTPKLSIDVILTDTVGCLNEVKATAAGFLKCSQVRTVHVFLEQSQTCGAQKLEPGNVVVHRTYSNQIGDSALSSVLMMCRSNFVLLTDTKTTPTKEWKRGIDAALSSCNSSMLAFPVVEMDGSRPNAHLPIYDCPNLVLSGFGLKLFPVVFARSRLLRIVESRNESCAAIEQAILDACISGQNADVINLPIIRRAAVKTSGGISPRLLAHCKSRLLLRHLPHLAAFNLEHYRPAAFAYATKKDILVKGTSIEKTFKKFWEFWKK